MKTWQIVILVYIITAIVGVQLYNLGAPPWMNFVAAVGITLLAILLIRRLKRPQSPST